MKFKRLCALLTALTIGFGLVGCGEKSSDEGEKVKITLLGSGYGDKSYWDSAKTGADQLETIYEGKVEVNVVDMTPDTTKWPAAMHEAGESDADLIITGGFQQKDNMEEVATQYPDKKWIMFDSDLDFAKGDMDHIYAMGYKASQSGYLAGMVAAYLTSSDNEGINEEKVIGFIGGMDNNPVVNDFLIGYVEGAKAVDKDIKVAVSYISSFIDTAKAKELSLVQVNSQKADVIFSVAGAAGIGCIEGAAEKGKYVIGVDSDQSILFEGRSEQDKIVTSALKRVDQSIIYAVGQYLEDKLPFGSYQDLGIKEESVGIVYNDIFKKYVSEDFVKELEAAEEKLVKEEITVSTAHGKTNDEIKAIVDSVRIK